MQKNNTLALHLHPELLVGLCTSWQSHAQVAAEQVQILCLSLYSGSGNMCTLESLVVLNKM